MLSLRRSLLVSGYLLLGGSLLIATLASGQSSASEEHGFPPLQTDVMVPDLNATETAPAGYATLPSGPAVDTPSRPIAPAIVQGPPEPIAPPPVDHLRVSLDWYPSPRHAALYVAQARDMFRHRGLRVEIATPADPEVPAKLLADSRVDLALTRQPLLHLLVDDGLPLIRVASLVSVPLDALIVSRESGIESLPQLEGKRIGHADRDGEQLLLPAMLAGSKLTLDDLDTPNVHYRLEEAVREGRVDGVIGGNRHLLPRSLANDGTATRSFPIEDHGVPLHDGLILVANREELRQRRDTIQRFIAALEEATAWILEHPRDSWPLLVATEPTLDTPVNRDAWPEIRARLTQSPGALSQGRYHAFERFLEDQGLAEGQHEVSRLAVDISTPAP